MEKSQKFESVAQAIITLLNQQGINAVSHSKVSRLAKVSRAWLYKYIGGKKSDLVDYATDHFGKIFLSIGGDASKSQTEAQLLEHAVSSSWVLLSTFAEYPEIIILYHKHLGQKTPIGKKIAELEEYQLQDMSRALMKIYKRTKKQARAIAEVMMAIRMGVSYRYSVFNFKDEYSHEEMKTALRQVFLNSVEMLKG